MVCTSQKYAADAGLEILKKGGNAADAAIACAAVLVVTEPTSNGLGSDAFSILWMNGGLYGINGSGYSPELMTYDELKRRGIEKMPFHGFEPVMVPGAVSVWVKLNERFGKLSLKEDLEPAIRFAREGFKVAPITARSWESAFRTYSGYTDPMFKPWMDTFTVNGHAPKAGEVFRSEDLARTLEIIAESNGEEFYKGTIADRIEEFSIRHGGFIRKDDLGEYEAEWVSPVSVNYRGYDVFELPPNGDGIVALMALNILEGYEFRERMSADTLHKQWEAMKLAFSDGNKYIADPRFMRKDWQTLLSKEYAAARRKQITEKAMDPHPGDPASYGTVYLCTADKDGNMVSFIQSNYAGFGSGIVIPGTGISLSDRGANFYLDPSSPNCAGPRKKSFHTIIPGFLMKDGKPLGPFGVMGGFMQPQGHVQVLMNMIDFGMDPQEALNAKRWQWLHDTVIEVEEGFDPEVLQVLRDKGHQIQITDQFTHFGRGQIILRDEDGIYHGASEPRADGKAAGY